MPTGIYPRTELHKQRNKEGHLGSHLSEETKKKLRKPHRPHKKRVPPEVVYGKALCRNRHYRARKMKALGSHTYGEWETLKAQYDWTCPGCGKREPQIVLTEDHIIPLILGGSHNIENIQPLCGPCNSRKHTKTIRYSPTKEINPLEEKEEETK